MSALRKAAPALALALAFAGPGAGADPDEAWIGRAATAPDIRPLLVLLVDTSESMARALEVAAPYDPTGSYAGACRADRVYWRRRPGPAPDCDGAQWISLAAATERSGWRCRAGSEALASTGVYVASRAAQWEGRPGGGYWRELRAGDDGAVECRADRGTHGGEAGPWFAAEDEAAPWSRDSRREIRWDAPPFADVHVFFSGNYLNYLAQALPAANTTLYDWLTGQVVAAAASVDEIHVALARLSHDGGAGDDAGEGGMIVVADAPLPAGAGRIAELLSAWRPAGPAPLGEALTEVAAWLSGETVGYGLASSAAPGEPLPSSADSRDPADPGRYRSPYSHACRAVTVGLLTSAAPSADATAAAAAGRLPGFDPGACADGCLPALARWMADSDLLAARPGRQFAQLHLLVPEASGAVAVDTARAARSALVDLRDPLALAMLLAQALQHDAAAGARAHPRISSPAYLPADASVLYSLSEPRHRMRWPGNLRRYRLAAGGSLLAAPAVVDRDGAPVFDEGTGEVLPETRSLWADAPDGAATSAGGAAGRLPAPQERGIHADLSDAPLTADANRIAPGNPSLSRELLGLSPQDPRTLTELVEWLQGRDVFDQDLDADTTAARQDLADPGTHPPAVLRHADGTATAFIATSDGMLHAVDVADGAERWALLPRPLLAHAGEVAADDPTTARRHGLDGRLVASVSDTDRDGLIDPARGESALMVAGFGRAGTGYYAVDVSQRDDPGLRWAHSAASLPGFARSWPEPVVARMRVDPARQSPGLEVVVLAGGYDPAERVGALSEPDPGAALAILDAHSGELLWMAAGRDVPAADVSPQAMRYSMPSAPRLVDRDGDGLVDLMYAVDLAGQLWRVDVAPAADGPSSIDLRVIATLGNGDQTAPRRFFHTPDVAYEPVGGRERLVVAFGSGRLSRPRETITADRFYAVFDELAGQSPDAAPVTDAELDDVSDATAVVGAAARGWKRRLEAHGPGEKVAGVASTFDHRLRFTTHRPLPPASDAPCGPPPAQNRLYTLDVRTGRAWRRLGDEERPSEELAGGGLPPGLRIVLPGEAAGSCTTSGCGAPVLLVGSLARRIEFRKVPVKTSWRQLDAPAD